MDDSLAGYCMKRGGGGGKGGGGGGGGTKCGRWNPTTEQVKVLSDLFKAGVRTPTTDEIQKISTQLSFYGQIESKNVFYWFQNHKARERHKRRKVLLQDHHHFLHYTQFQRHQNIIPSATNLSEMDEEMMETERVKETLQLFPLNPYNETGHEKLRFYANDCRKGNHSNHLGGEMDHPTLDLRLSFL